MEGPLGSNYWKLFVASTISNLGDGLGKIAYPWLASAVTRNPILITLVVVAQRLPWLLFSLPAGVITDRFDRVRLMVGANVTRAIITGVVAVGVAWQGSSLLSPAELEADPDAVGPTKVGLYLLIVVATMLLGIGEVLYDNTAQTFVPRIVDKPNLEKANGRLWGAEMVADSFAGPPLAALLLTISFAAPFGVDALTFALSAALMAWIVVPTARATPAPVEAPAETTGDGVATTSWVEEAKVGFGWLWHHDFFRPLAIILGFLNLVYIVGTASLVLFAQEVLETSPGQFAVLTMGGAVGGVVGGWTASWISKRIGSGPSLWLTLIGGGLTSLVVGFTSWWVLVAVMMGLFTVLAVLWNVITVSLRQAAIPDHLLGRVNSVYRFFAWGMMPIGALLGGLIIAVVEQVVDREWALRAPWIAAAVGHFILLAYAAPKLTTARIEAVRAASN